MPSHHKSPSPDSKAAHPSVAPSLQTDDSNQASFMGLPPELRNKIYYLVASKTCTVLLRNTKIIDPPLSRTCKQVREEYLPIFKASRLPGVTQLEARVEISSSTASTTFSAASTPSCRAFTWPWFSIRPKR